MKYFFSFVLYAFMISQCFSDDKATQNDKPLKLQSYESNMLGYTWDSDDVPFMDFKLSVLYPMFHDGQYQGNNSWNYFPYPHFSFTGRFGQYIETRNSSPVVGKRFNPKLFGRYWLGSNDDYLDIGFAHESNGQSIDTEEAYLRLRDSYIQDGESADFADDAISRGWDYVGLTLKNLYRFSGKSSLTTYIDYRYFIEHGPLQGAKEELNAWENFDVYLQRKQVHGIMLSAMYDQSFNSTLKYGIRAALIYQTGYKDTFDYNTFRTEFTLKSDIPFMIWYSSGYDSDLVGYYKKVESFGIALALSSYL